MAAALWRANHGNFANFANFATFSPGTGLLAGDSSVPGYCYPGWGLIVASLSHLENPAFTQKLLGQLSVFQVSVGENGGVVSRGAVAIVNSAPTSGVWAVGTGGTFAPAYAEQGANRLGRVEVEFDLHPREGICKQWQS